MYLNFFKSNIGQFGLICCSIVIWLLSSPGQPFPFIAWLLFVPFGIACFFCSCKRKAIFWGVICGFVIWLYSIWWSIYELQMMLPGRAILAWASIFCLAFINGLPWGILGLLIQYKKALNNIYGIIAAAAMFALTHYFINLILPGNIALSQWQQITLIQILDIGGQPLLIFVMTLFSLSIAASIINTSKKRFLFLGLALLILIIICSYGILKLQYLKYLTTKNTSLHIGMIQANFPINNLSSSIISKQYKILFDETIKLPENIKKNYVPLDFIIWPELPNSYFIDQIEEKLNSNKVNLPAKFLIFEGEESQTTKELGNINYETGYVLDKEFAVIGKQYKIHLMPFAEYLPFANEFPIMKTFFDNDLGLVAGKHITPITYNKNIKFALLICYDGLFPSVFRKAVAANANFVINLADDAEFGKTNGPYFTLSNVVFEAVSFRIPIIRVANSGISAVITSSGFLLKNTLHDTFKSKSLAENISIPNNVPQTFYFKHPNVIIYTLIFLFALGFFRKI